LTHSPIKLLNGSKDNNNGEDAEALKFDMKTLDSAILEIENFISDLDSKL